MPRVKEWKCKPCEKEHNRREFFKKAGLGVAGTVAAATGIDRLLINPRKGMATGGTQAITNYSIAGGTTINYSYIPGSAHDINTDAAGDLYALGVDGKIYSYQGGGNWSDLSHGNCFMGFETSPSNDLWGLFDPESDPTYIGPGGMQVMYYNGSSWPPVGNGSGFAITLAPGLGHAKQWAVNNHWDKYQYSGSWNKYNLPVYGLPIAVADDGTALAQGASFVSGSNAGRVFEFTPGGSQWVLCGGSYSNTNYKLCPYQNGYGYLVQANTAPPTVWVLGTGGNFSKLGKQPPSSASFVRDAAASRDGTLWMIDNNSVVFAYLIGQNKWLTGPQVDQDIIVASSTTTAFGLNMQNNAQPTAIPDFTPVWNWFRNANYWLYGEGNTPQGTIYNWLTSWKSVLNSINTSGGTLPSYSQFNNMYQEFFTLIQQVAGETNTDSFNNFLYDFPHLTITNLAQFAQQNSPPNQSVIKLLNPSNTTYMKNYLSGQYGISSPTGSLQNGNGWLDLIKIPDWGGSTIPAGLHSVLNPDTADGPLEAYDLALAFSQGSSFSSIPCATNKQTINALACFANLIHQVSLECGLTGWIVDPHIFAFLHDMLGATMSMIAGLVAVNNFNSTCGSINWSNWGNL